MKSSGGRVPERPLADLLAARAPLVLDGAIGTELERRGVAAGLPLWSAAPLLSDPEAIGAVHRDYVDAGVDILCTATFRTTARTFRRAGLPDRSAECTALAVRLARASTANAGRTVLVAGSMGPLEDCYRPDLVPPEAEVRREQAEHARRLADAGVDFLFLETFGTIREAAIACEEAVRTGRETLVSFVCRPDGRIYSGEPLDDAVAALAPLGPAGVAINCLQPPYLLAAVSSLRQLLLRVPGGSEYALGAYANVGRVGEESSGRLVCDIAPVEYGAWAERFVEAGATIVGGCCGTTPDHIRAVSHRLAALRARPTEGARA
jgi:S-methylmethionine-dependent homocysteine/selenocysteine methylase